MPRTASSSLMFFSTISPIATKRPIDSTICTTITTIIVMTGTKENTGMPK